jgi:hypothetical protein
MNFLNLSATLQYTVYNYKLGDKHYDFVFQPFFYTTNAEFQKKHFYKFYKFSLY